MADEEKRPESNEDELSASKDEAQDAKDESQSSANASSESEGDTTGSDPAESSIGDEAKEDGEGEAETTLADDVASAMTQFDDAHTTESAKHHDSHGHGGHGDEHFAHTSPMSLLLGVLGALILLTVLTVGVTAIDLGGQGNFIVAMVIATVKAILVMAYFMHMVWDAKFNVVAFTSSFLFVLLFLAMTLGDRGEYQKDIDDWEVQQRLDALP